MHDEHQFNFIDTHAHIYLQEFDKDRKEIIEKAGEAGVTKIYMPNLDQTSIDAMLEAEFKFPRTCIPMMGLHPCYVNKNFQRELYIVEEWINKKKFAAIGEIGLDFYWDTTFKKEQEEALKVQIQMAVQADLPIVIHCRNSIKETIEIIRDLNLNLKGIFHCFSGNLEEAKEVIALGFLLGIGGVVTFKNGGLDKVVSELSIENIVLETDSPYLTPAPYRKERNNPSQILTIAEKVASLINIPLQEVAEITTKNALQIFKL